MNAARLLLALACDAPGAEIERAFLGTTLTEAAALARATGMTAALARFVARRGTLGDEGRRLVASGLLAEARGRACLDLLREVAAAAGCEAVAVKGAGLAIAGLYSGERELGDADVLVREADLPAWIEAGRRAGAEVTPCTEAHELAYLRRGPALVELHAALPAAVGKDRGPGWEAVRAVAGPEATGWPGVRPVGGHAAREIAVHHFVFHHGGDPAHALRAMQDLARLRGSGGPGLLWGAHVPDAALARLTEVGERVRVGEFDGCVAEFLERFGVVQALRASADSEFADVIDRWLALRRSAGEGRAAFVIRRSFPPGLKPGARIARPFRLAGRYLAGWARKNRRDVRERNAWRRFLEGSRATEER